MLCQLPDRPGLRFGSYGKVVAKISMCTYTDIQDILWPENFLSRNVSKCQAYITHGTWTIGIGFAQSCRTIKGVVVFIPC